MTPIRVALVEDNNLISALTHHFLKYMPELQLVICISSARVSARFSKLWRRDWQLSK